MRASGSSRKRAGVPPRTPRRAVASRMQSSSQVTLATSTPRVPIRTAPGSRTVSRGLLVSGGVPGGAGGGSSVVTLPAALRSLFEALRSVPAAGVVSTRTTSYSVPGASPVVCPPTTRGPPAAGRAFAGVSMVRPPPTGVSSKRTVPGAPPVSTSPESVAWVSPISLASPRTAEAGSAGVVKEAGALWSVPPSLLTVTR